MVGGNITESSIQRAGREIAVASSGCKLCVWFRFRDSAGPCGLYFFRSRQLPITEIKVCFFPISEESSRAAFASLSIA